MDKLKVMKCTKTENGNFMLTVQHDLMLFGQKGLKVNTYYVAVKTAVPVDAEFEDDLSKYNIVERKATREFKETDAAGVESVRIEQHTYRYLHAKVTVIKAAA